jgi:hypothetical protein
LKRIYTCMSKITLGDVIIIREEEHLILEDQRLENTQLKIDSAYLQDLIDFLVSQKTDETKARMGFRVPIISSHELCVKVNDSHKTRQCTPLNISLSGILLDFMGIDNPDWSKNEELKVTLQFKNKQITLRGKVSRCFENQYGVFFPDCMRQGILDPPEILSYIVGELEREWLSDKLDREEFG